MNYDELNARAYDEARRHFISMLLDGINLDAAILKRAEVYEAMRRSRCSHCHVEKHVSEFNACFSSNRVQSWCRQCMSNDKKERLAAWKKALAEA